MRCNRYELVCRVYIEYSLYQFDLFNFKFIRCIYGIDIISSRVNLSHITMAESTIAGGAKKRPAAKKAAPKKKPAAKKAAPKKKPATKKK